MVNHTRSGTQAPQSANLMRHMRVRTNGLIPGEPKEPSPEPKEPSPGSQGRFFWLTPSSGPEGEIFSAR